MKQAATIELFSYWDSLRAGTNKAHLEVATAQVRTALAGTFLVEVDERRAYPLRVIGGSLARLTANARLGASFLECWEAESRDLLETMLQVVHEERLPVVLGARARMNEGRRLPVECLLLPLAAGQSGKPRILGGLAPSGPLDRRGSAYPLEINSARTIRDSTFALEMSCALPVPPPASRIQQATPPAPLPTGIRGSGARLRVIDGGRS